MNGEKIPLNDLSDRELLVLTAQKVNELPALMERVDKLETWRDRILGALGLLTGGGGIIEWLIHKK